MINLDDITKGNISKQKRKWRQMALQIYRILIDWWFRI